jgi:hypothetical protein
MTVREVIAALERVAETLPRGLDSTVMLVMAMDEEVSVTSIEIEVSRLHLVAEGDISNRMIVPIVKGHAYVDRAKGNLGGYSEVKEDLDEALRRLTEED